MGREVRRVPSDWNHPKRIHPADRYVPLREGFAEADSSFRAMESEKGREEAIDYFGSEPAVDDYMPDWAPEECTHWQMYETCSEGTPISPVMESPKVLAKWLHESGGSFLGGGTTSEKHWLAIIEGRTHGLLTFIMRMKGESK